MVTVRAPALVAGGRRAPLDLVVVLDAGGSMAADGAKLEHVKRVVTFVVDSLGPRDRLAVVSFDSGGARRVLRLTRMSEAGKAAAKRAVNSLVAAAGSGTASANVCGGLDEAAKVLCDSRHDNDVAAVILVSDGEGLASTTTTTSDDHNGLVPPFLTRGNCCGNRRTPVHAFLLGSGDHGAAAAMHHVSEVTGGTFSFIEEDDHHAAFIQVAAVGVSVSVDLRCVGARLKAVKSVPYKSYHKSHLDRDMDVMVSLGDLYGKVGRLREEGDDGGERDAGKD
ncbi:unnamed protein product [Urochloa humidicola]